MKLAGAACAAAIALGCASAASAQSAGALVVKDANGVARSLGAWVDSLGFLHYRNLLEGLYGSTPQPVAVDGAGALSVNVMSSSLPTGAATSGAQTTGNNSLAAIAANTAGTGLGALASVPAGSTNGTALGSMPTGAKGARLYLQAGATITFTVASTAPASAPAATFTVSAPTTSTGASWDENLTGGAMIYVTAITGSPKFRWF